MPGSLQGGGVGNLAVFGEFGVKNHPEKEVSAQAQKMPARPTCCLLGLGLGLGS